MDATSDPKELLTNLSSAKKDISALRSELNELNEKKEGLFEDKDKVSKKIIAFITEIKVLKRERDDYTRKVRSLKEDRKKINDEIKTLSEDLKKLSDTKESFKKDQKLNINPESIKRKIEEMEFSIETEGMSFENEKKVMLKINEMKKQLDGSKEFIEVFDGLRTKRNRIRDLRKNANVVHRSVQDNAKNSQDRHEKILELSKQIDELKKEEADQYAKFMTAKEEFNKVNDSLKGMLVGINSINDELRKHKIKTKEESHDRETKTLEEKTRQVNEKIKTRKKLTTEDLLIYQKTALDEEPEEEVKTDKK